MGDDHEDASDPVDALADEVADREGDPFEDLRPADRGPEGAETDEDASVEGPGPTDPVPGDPTAGASEPLEDQAADPFTAAERAFEAMDVDDLDADQVWEALEDAQERGSVGTGEERTYAVVSKHSYCENCQYFTEPPEIACGHEGTEILEFPDLETVRVVDCPVVAERRSLQRER